MKKTRPTGFIRYRKTPFFGLICAAMLFASPASADLLALPFDGNTSPGSIYQKDNCKAVEGGLTAYPCVKYVPGKQGQAIQLNQYSVVAAPVNLDPHQTPQITFTAWIYRPRSGGRSGYLLSSGGSGGLPHFSLYGGALSINGGRSSIRYPEELPELPREEWVFVAGIWDYEAQTMRLHQNDAHQSYSDLKMDLDPSTNFVVAESPTWAAPNESGGEKGHYVFIGAANTVSMGVTATKVAIDDVRLFSRALSVAEVDAIRQGKTGKPYAVGTAPASDPVKTIEESSKQTLGDQFEPKPTGLDQGPPSASDLLATQGVMPKPTGLDQGPPSAEDQSDLEAGQQIRSLESDAPPSTSGQNDASGFPMSMMPGGGSNLSSDTTDALQKARDENAAPEIIYGSEEEGEAAAVVAPAEREAAAASAATAPQADNILPGTVAPLAIPGGLDDSSPTATNIDAGELLTDQPVPVRPSFPSVDDLTASDDTIYSACYAPEDCKGMGSQCLDITVPAENTEGSMCTRSCTADSQCVASNGFTGACYSIGSSTAACFQRCGNNDDCDSETRCISVTLPGGTLDRVCVPD